MHANKLGYTILMSLVIAAMIMAGCGPAATTVAPTSVPPTAVPPTKVPNTAVPPTAVPPTAVPPTAVPTPEPTKWAPSGTINVALTSDIPGIWPSNAPEWQSGIAAAAFEEGSQWQNPETGLWEPTLVLTCDASADFKTFVFHLRPNVQFANGEPYNADAYVFSYDLFSNTEKVKLAWPWPGPDLVQVEKVDDLTVKMTRTDATPNWCNDVNADVAPPKYVQEVGVDAFLAKPIGTGAFVVDEWVRGSHVSGHANPLFWRWDQGYPKAAEIVFKFIPDSATRIAALKTGEVDVITRLTAEDAATLANEANIKVVEYAMNRVYYVAFNNLTTGIGTPIINQDVRLALNYAVDKQAIIDTLFSGKGAIPTGLVVPGDIGYDANLGLKPFPYDRDKAEELLKAAGYPDGFEIGFACPDAASSHANDVCQAIEGYFNAVGVTLAGGGVEFMDTGKFWDLEGKVGGSQLPPLFMDSWSSSGNPWGRVNGALGKTGAYRNWFDQRIQDQLDIIEGTGDMAVKIKAYGEIQKIMIADPFFIYLYQPYTFEATSTRIEGYQPRSNESFDVWSISVKE